MRRLGAHFVVPRLYAKFHNFVLLKMSLECLTVGKKYGTCAYTAVQEYPWIDITHENIKLKSISFLIVSSLCLYLTLTSRLLDLGHFFPPLNRSKSLSCSGP